MDKEQEEMQFLGLIDIYVESYKVIFAWRRIFSKITLALILPLSFIYLAHMEVSNLIFKRIDQDESQLEHTNSGTPTHDKLAALLSKEWAYFLLFKAAYLTLFLVFSLLSTAAVVYSIASIYAARELTFDRVISVVPKVWKRLMVTFLSIFVAMFFYNAGALAIMIPIAIYSALVNDAALALLIIVFILYLGGFLYLTIIWHLASVVSVLEEAYGFQAMAKARNLIKGKLGVAIVIFLKLNLTLGIIQFAFQRLVVHGSSLGMVSRACYGVICFLLLSKLFLFGLVIQTVIYFVCKSYHHENIDKTALSDHLEVYLLGEYEPLKAKDVQLEQYHV